MAATKSKNPATQGASRQRDKAKVPVKAKTRKSKGNALTDEEILARVKAQGLAQIWAAEDDAQEDRRLRNRKTASRRAPTPTIQFDDSDEANENEDSQSSENSDDETQGNDQDQDDDEYEDDEDADALETEPQQSAKKKGASAKRTRHEPECESEEHPKKKHRRGAEVPEVEIRSTRPLARPLPKPRSSTGHRPATAVPVAQGTDAGISTPSAAPTIPAPPSTPQRPATHTAPADAPTAQVPCTPYVRIPNPGRRHETTETLLTPTTSNIFDMVKPQFLVHVLTQNAFPTLKEAVTTLKPMIVDASKTGEANTKKRYLRITDQIFVNDLVKLAFGRASALRSHMIKTAKRLVIEHHKLDVFKKTKERRAAVKKLLHKHAFIHEDPADLKSGMFQHPALCALIVQALFSSSLPGYNLGCSDAYTSAFDPIPLPLVALAAVTLQCALEQWKSGKFTPIQFKAEFYRAKYMKLRGKLDEFVSGEDVAEIFAEERAEWYKSAMESCGAYDSDDNDLSSDEDDDDLIAQNQAAFKAKRAAAAAAAVAKAAAAQAAAGSAGDG